MASGNPRWVEVSPSAFDHEREGLEIVKGLLPNETPFRAWSNFEFRDSRGGWHEVDLLLLARDTLFLVELKHYAGTLRGDDQTWWRSGKRPEQSPLKLARHKAQLFAARLKDELRAWAGEKGVRVNERDIVPFVKEVVFLHHPHGRCELPPNSRLDLYGLDGAEDITGLPGISGLFHRESRRAPIGENQELILVQLLARIGLVQRRDREAGSWVIQEDPIDSGEGWQDWLAHHKVSQQERARIRFQITDPSAPTAERREQQRVAENEFRVMSRLSHDGLLRPRDLVDSELGIGLVYPYDEEAQRLDLWLAGQPKGVSLSTQLTIIRQIGEALHYAHGNRVVHRALNPRSVWVRKGLGSQEVSVQIGDWQAAGLTSTETGTRFDGVTSLHLGVPDRSGPTDAEQEADLDRTLSEAFLAPEGVWSPTADRVRLDVFALGALAYYLLTGAPPAPTATSLKARLLSQGGLDVAVALPQVSSELRTLILRATDPLPTRRLGDVGSFLGLLAAAEKVSLEPQEESDPLAAAPGSRLDGRFVLDRRLGQGSTAVGLLVQDQLHGSSRVLKVALNEDATRRLQDEAEVLRQIKHPRIVTLVEGPISVGGRQALLLESAGTETLADELRQRTRLSIDRLERYGTDLMDALVALDKAGIDHRDIKPSNLGVLEGRGDRQKHLVLFDFSLTRAAASSTSAGTPPYLDPFFDDSRSSYDSAAERYSAAVVLFEMATGRTPVYGDGSADPAAIHDEATITKDLFDPALAVQLGRFFRKALARDAAKRHNTAEAMRTAWRSVFAAEATTAPDDTDDELATQATPGTPLRKSGLTARALSALEPLALATVGDLLTVDPVSISRLRGVADVTRKQINARIKQWRSQLGITASPAASGAESLTDAADILLGAITSQRRKDLSRAGVVRLILGIGSPLEAFATQAELGAHLDQPVSAARANQINAELQEAWAKKAETRALLNQLLKAVSGRLADLGGVATPDELAAAVAEALGGDASSDPRLARGLTRLAIERGRALSRADEDSAVAIEPRRRAGTVTFFSADPALFDVAEALGAEADRLVAALGDPQGEVVPAARANERLRAMVSGDVSSALVDPARLARLGAAAAIRARASGRGELHTVDLQPSTALALALSGFGGSQSILPREVRDRVAVRFPALAPLPERPELDALVDAAGLGLIFDDVARTYRSRELTNHTTGLETRSPTVHELASAPVSEAGPFGVRLRDSVRSRSFVALGVRPERLGESVAALQAAFDADVVDLTALLIDALKAQTTEGRLTWDVVKAADAAPEGSRARAGLAELVKRAWPVVEAALEEAVEGSGDPDRPIVITDAAPLARYAHMDLLVRWTDLASPRERAVWLLVPQPGGNHGALLDGSPIPLAAPSQFVPLDSDWIDTTAARAPRAAATTKDT